jgi:hypothetical protein
VTPSGTRLLATLSGLAAALLLALPAAALAQRSGDGFLFRVPTWRLAILGGIAQPRGSSDIYEFVTDELTLTRGSFAGALAGASLAFRIAPRVDLSLSASYAGRSAGSEFRRFVGEDDLPVEQRTELHRVPIMASVRLALVPPGRAVGRFAWIPTRVVPFVGGGAGAVWYRLSQDGDFIDKETLDIFADTFESTGWSVGATAFAGSDVSLGPRYGVTAEGRYLWSKGPMKGDFSTFNKIDLSGYDASIGLYVRF